MSLKSYFAGIVTAILPFVRDETEHLVKLEAEKYLAPLEASAVEAAVDREVDALVAKFGPNPPPVVVVAVAAKAVPK